MYNVMFLCQAETTHGMGANKTPFVLNYCFKSRTSDIMIMFLKYTEVQLHHKHGSAHACILQTLVCRYFPPQEQVERGALQPCRLTGKSQA